jgi:hypothetical protein
MPPKRSGKRRAARVQQEDRVLTPDLQIKLLRNIDFSALFTVQVPVRTPVLNRFMLYHVLLSTCGHTVCASMTS